MVLVSQVVKMYIVEMAKKVVTTVKEADRFHGAVNLNISTAANATNPDNEMLPIIFQDSLYE